MSKLPRKAWKEAIMEYSKELKLPLIGMLLEEHVKEASQRDTGYEEFLAQLLEKECDAKREASRYNLVRRAEFPHKNYLEDLSVSDLPEDGQNKLKMLKSLEFISEGRNIILSGNSGTGKTHMAIGLGLKACLEGYKVWFTTVPLLINRIKE